MNLVGSFHPVEMRKDHAQGLVQHLSHIVEFPPGEGKGEISWGVNLQLGRRKTQLFLIL